MRRVTNHIKSVKTPQVISMQQKYVFALSYPTLTPAFGSWMATVTMNTLFGRHCVKMRKVDRPSAESPHLYYLHNIRLL